MVAAVVIFFILVIHFHKVNIATLIFSNMTLCLFGTAVGILIQGVDCVSLQGCQLLMQSIIQPAAV